MRCILYYSQESCRRKFYQRLLLVLGQYYAFCFCVTISCFKSCMLCYSQESCSKTFSQLLLHCPACKWHFSLWLFHAESKQTKTRSFIFACLLFLGFLQSFFRWFHWFVQNDSIAFAYVLRSNSKSAIMQTQKCFGTHRTVTFFTRCVHTTNLI